MSNFTQNVILTTFGEMLETTPFDKITVSAIVKACGISRNTFYYHYQDIFELLDDWLQQELGKFGSTVEDGDWQDSIKDFLHACKAHKKRVYHIFNSISRDRMERYIFTGTDNVVHDYVRMRAKGKTVSEQRITAISDICRYAIIGYFLRFLWNGMTDDIDSAVDALGAMFIEIVEQVVGQADTTS